MAIHAQSSCTLSTITDVEAVYTYYYLSDSTITVNEAPKDNVNPPGASTITVISDEHSYVWQITEPQLDIEDDVIQTAVGKLYYIECVEFSDGTYDWGPLMTSSTYAAAKAAYNLSSQALSQAQAANEATALLGGHFIYNSTWETTNTPHSANVVQTVLKNGIDVTQDPTKWDYNVHIGANGIRLRNNESILSEWTSTALKFNNPNTGNAQLIIGANGTLQSGNYSYSSGSIFSNTGTKIDLTDGTIYSPYFRILTTTLNNNQPGAYIKGDVVAQTGRFGSSSNNYWLIDTYYDANQQEYYSSLRGIGNSFIQLGSNNTWTLGTNRINSSWRYTSSDASGVTNPFLLRYKRFGNTTNDGYYDYGMNLPTILNSSDQNAERIADKFLYIRTANYVPDNNLANLNSDANWTYPFYVDGQGNVRAKAFYIGNSTTSIGGGAGTIAEKLMTGAGSVSQPVYFRSDTGHVGEVAAIDYTIQSNVPANAVFTDHITTATTNGTGNAVTSVTADASGNLTITKGTTFLTSYTETDPTVPAWAKATNKPTYSYSEITGTVPQSALPSYVDDVLEYDEQSDFPATGESGKIYVDISTNKTYRWGGSTYVEISSSLALGETSTTAYRGDRGKTAYDHANTKGSAFTSGLYKITTNSEGHVTAAVAASKSDISLGNVENKSSATIRSEITSDNVTNALGFTPYDATNPNGYITSADVSDTHVNVSTRGSTKAYLLATTSSPTSTKTAREAVAETGVYLETNNSATRLIAPTFVGNLTGTASGNLTSASTLNWNNITQNKPTTISGYGITDAKIDNGIVTLGSNTISKMPNPNTLTIKVYNANTATAQDSNYSPTEVSYDGSTSGKTASVAGTNAITNISAAAASGGSSTFTVIKADGSSSTFNVNISGAVVSGAIILTDSNGVGLNVNGPIYFDAGIPKSMRPNTSTGLYLKDDGTWGTPGGTYSLPIATYNVLGGLKPWYSTTGASTLASGGAGTNTSTPSINARSTTAGKYYAVEIDKNGRLFVNVPWAADTNTWRAIQVNGTDILDTSTNTNKLNLKAGSNVTITNDSGTVTIASSYTNTDTKVTQAYSTTNNSYPLLMTATAGVSSTSSRGDTTAILNNAIYANPSTGILNIIGLSAKKINNYLTGSGTAASDKGSGVSPRYFPAKWTFNANITPSNGDIIIIKLPVAGHSYGVFLSTDNGTNYYPVVVGNGTSRLTTHYGNGTPIQLIFDSNGSAADMYALNGADARATVTGGVWRVLNYYGDGNTIPQAYCSTAAATAAKAASMSGYVATANRYVMVTMTQANSSAGAITLNINSTGAKPIYINGSASSTSNYTLPAGSYLVFYNGINYYFRTDNIITGNITGNAATATKLASAQTVYVTLGTASTTTTIQGGSSSAQTIGVNGTLGIGNGGTGLTSSPSMLTNLGSTTAANVLQASPRPGITGTLGVANGGTGQTSLTNAANSLLNALSTGSSTPVDNDYYISQYVNGGTTTTTYHRRPMSALWSYINEKISSSGTYVTIATDQTITASQKTFNGAIRWGTASKYGAAYYDSTLEAIVFSFA